MKRAIFVLVLLTVGVILPPLYSQWTESQRQIQIQAVKQKARPVVGDRLEPSYQALKQANRPLWLSCIPAARGAIWSCAGVIKNNRVDFRDARLS